MTNNVCVIPVQHILDQSGWSVCRYTVYSRI